MHPAMYGMATATLFILAVQMPFTFWWLKRQTATRGQFLFGLIGSAAITAAILWFGVWRIGLANIAAGRI